MTITSTIWLLCIPKFESQAHCPLSELPAIRVCGWFHSLHSLSPLSYNSVLKEQPKLWHEISNLIGTLAMLIDDLEVDPCDSQ